MAIVVDYTPGDTVQQLATQTGINRVAQQQVEFEQQQQLMQLNNQLQQQNMKFAQQAEQQARAEEAGYRMQLLSAQRNIDIEMQTMTYQRDREKLNLALDMIRDADYLTDEEKSELTLQAGTRYGTGSNLPMFTNKLDPFERKWRESYVLSNMANELLAQVKAGTLTPEQARFQYINMGGNSNVKFTTPGDDANLHLSRLVEDLKKAQDAFDATFAMDGNDIINKVTKAVVEEGTLEYSTAKTLLSAVDKRTKELAAFEQGDIIAKELEAKWGNLKTTNLSIQKLIKLNGEANAKKLWIKRELEGKSDIDYSMFSASPYNGSPNPPPYNGMAAGWGGFYY